MDAREAQRPCQCAEYAQSRKTLAPVCQKHRIERDMLNRGANPRSDPGNKYRRRMPAEISLTFIAKTEFRGRAAENLAQAQPDRKMAAGAALARTLSPGDSRHLP